MKNGPNFFIVGVWKAGTTSLYEYLSKIPGIYLSEIKEPKFFHGEQFKSLLRPESIRIENKEKYEKLFKNVKNETAIGDASPSYFSDPSTPNLIFKEIPDAKIIIMLRDPVQRAFSHYLMLYSRGFEKKSFSDVLTSTISKKKEGNDEFNLCIDPGLYVDNIKRYQKIFGSSNVKIIIFEEFIKNPTTIVNDVLCFLGIKEKAIEISKVSNPYRASRGKFGKFIFGSKTINQAARIFLSQDQRWKLKEKVVLKNEKKPEILENERLLLEKFYLKDVVELQNLLDKKLPWKWMGKFKST